MRVAIPHSLPRAEVRRRLRERSHEIADHVPGGLAEVSIEWTGEDCMRMTIGVMGQVLDGQIDIEDHEMVFTMDLPMMLGFIEPIIGKAVSENGTKMLAAPVPDRD